MWFCKKREEPPVVKLAKECEACGHLIAIGRGKKVYDSRRYESAPLFYCEGCAPPYDKVCRTFPGEWTFYKTIAAHDVQVTEKGKPIKAKGK